MQGLWYWYQKMLSNFSLFFLVSALVAASSQLILKKASMDESDRFKYKLLLGFDVRIVIAYFMLLSSSFINIFGLRESGLAAAVIVRPLSIVFVGVFGFALLKEEFSKRELFAYVLIVLGIVLIAL